MKRIGFIDNTGKLDKVGPFVGGIAPIYVVKVTVNRTLCVANIVRGLLQLLISERNHRINFRRPSGRNVARQQRDYR